MTTALAWIAGAALVLVGVLLVRRQRLEAAGGEAIRLVTTRYLGAKSYLTLVEVDGERLLLGVAGDKVGLVARLGQSGATPLEPRADV